MIKENQDKNKIVQWLNILMSKNKTLLNGEQICNEVKKKDQMQSKKAKRKKNM